MKRAIREAAHELSPALFAGHRSRLIIPQLAERLEKRGVVSAKALELAGKVGDYLGKSDAAAEKKGEHKIKTLMFLSPAELDSLADALGEMVKKEPAAKEIEKSISKSCKAAGLKDAADIAIFGRMVASDHSLTLEGAGLFSHALSTHKAENDIDFFSAIDDLQAAEEAGAGMTGIIEFTSATYYRYAGLNLDLLADDAHLGNLKSEERREVVNTFLRSAILAVPGARKNSMNAHTLPGYVLGLLKSAGQPLQLVNAFEKPILARSGGGLMEPSIDALRKHHEHLKSTWDIQLTKESEIPRDSLNKFCEEICRHVI